MTGKQLLFAVAAVSALVLPSASFAFLGLFEDEPPETAISYDQEKCGSRGGIKIVIRNPTDEPLARVSGKVTIYRPETSRTAASFGFGTDRVIKAGTAMYFCNRVPLLYVANVLSAMDPGLSPNGLLDKYGNDNEVASATLLTGAILKFEVTEFEYGLPY